VIFSVEKRKFRKGGSVQETSCFYLRYRFGDMPVDKWKSLGVSDKQAAESLGRKFFEEQQQEASGIIVPKLMRDAAQRPLVEHLNDYESDLVTRGRAGRGGRGARLLKARIARLLDDCLWTLAGQVSADSFVKWRDRQKPVSARTKNHYLQGMISFLNWMERMGRIKSNPLKFVGKVDERGQRVRERRAFTVEELRKVVLGSGPRGIIYFTAAATGLRQEELKQLLWRDILLEAIYPHIVVRVETTKTKTEKPVYLMPEIVEALNDHRPAHCSPSDLVFPNGIPRASRLKVDSERVGVAYRDERKRYADFHALRYMCATFMRKHGISDNFATKQMRHQSIRQTDGYTDESQLPIYEAIKALPPLLGYTQIRAQILGANGQIVAQSGATVEGTKLAQVVVNEAVCHGLAHCGAVVDLERAKGFEPSTFTLAR
jgi:integrase